MRPDNGDDYFITRGPFYRESRTVRRRYVEDFVSEKARAGSNRARIQRDEILERVVKERGDGFRSAPQMAPTVSLRNCLRARTVSPREVRRPFERPSYFGNCPCRVCGFAYTSRKHCVHTLR